MSLVVQRRYESGYREREIWQARRRIGEAGDGRHGYRCEGSLANINNIAVIVAGIVITHAAIAAATLVTPLRHIAATVAAHARCALRGAAAVAIYASHARHLSPVTRQMPLSPC